MWLGLFIINFTLLVWGSVFGVALKDSEHELISDFGYMVAFVGMVSLPLISIAYGISLIINS